MDKAIKKATDAETLWTAASEILRSQYSAGIWQSTFAQAKPLDLSKKQFVLGLPNGITRDKLDGKFRPFVEEAVSEAAGHAIQVKFETVLPTLFDPDSIDSTNEIDLRLDEEKKVSKPAKPPVSKDSTNENPLPGDTSRYTFETFIIGQSNRFAHAAALSVAERPGGSYNPLFIYGSAGLGKTHILRAVENFVITVYPRLTVLYVSTETFLNEFVDSIKNSSGNDFKNRYRKIDVLLIDDIQFIEGKDRLQEELFHTFNDLYGANKQIVLSSDRPPDAIPTLEDRLKSRFMMGLLTDIQPPDIETRMAILSKKSDLDGFDLPNDVSEFIAENIKNNIRELEGALNKVAAHANLFKEPLSTELAETVLGDFIANRQPRPITVEMIIEATKDQFGFSADELKGKSRRRPLVMARQMAMYVARQLTDLSFPMIAREFGGRDHTTVMHACDKIDALMKERSQIYNHVMSLEKAVRNQAQSVDF